MSEETAVAAAPSAAPAVMEIESGPLVNLTSEERAEFSRTGELPKPKNEEAATSSESQPVEGETKQAGESDPPQKKQDKPKGEAKPKQTAEERIAELKATIAKIEKGAGIKTESAESSPAKLAPEAPPKPTEPPPTRPKPTVDDKKEDGSPRFESYDDYVEDLADWKAEQREAKQQREQAVKAQAVAFNAMVEKGRARYDNFDSVVQPTAAAINEDAAISPAVKQMLLDSDVLPDLVYTLGTDPAELAKFVEMARTQPGKALRYIALTESLIAEELAGKPATEDPPAKPTTKAPRPPSEAGGRAAAPPDALEAAAAANDFRKFSEESTRRQLAKLKG